jgi:hypothetical protein
MRSLLRSGGCSAARLPARNRSTAPIPALVVAGAADHDDIAVGVCSSIRDANKMLFRGACLLLAPVGLGVFGLDGRCRYLCRSSATGARGEEQAGGGSAWTASLWSFAGCSLIGEDAIAVRTRVSIASNCISSRGRRAQVRPLADSSVRYWASAFIRARSLPDKPRPFFGRRAPFASMTASNWSY